MLNNKSTRSIVTGKRPEEDSLGAETTVSGRNVSEPTETLEAVQQKTEKENIDNKAVGIEKLKSGRKWWIWLAGAIGLMAVAVCLFARMLLPRTDIADGMSIIAVQADAALIDYVKPGDVVRIYDTHGQIIQALQYVQVYRTTEFKQLLLAVDGVQAASLAAHDISPKMVVVCHKDQEMAAQMLQMQSQLNNPKIILSMPEMVTLAPDATEELKVEVSVEPAEAIVPPVQWTTSDPAVVEVDNGTLVAKGVGNATVTASCGNTQVQCAVSVEILLQSVVLDRTDAALSVGETMSISASAQPENTTHFDVVWSSSDPAVATVNGDGTVTAVAPGTTTITATSGSISTSCKVAVGVRAEIMVLDKMSLTLETGQTEKLTYTVYPTEAIDTVTYESTDPAIATVSEDGIVTAVAPGVCGIIFRCGEVETSCAVIVNESPE